MAKKTCAQCVHYGDVEIVPGSKTTGCTLTVTRLQSEQDACKDFSPKKPAKG